MQRQTTIHPVPSGYSSDYTLSLNSAQTVGGILWRGGLADEDRPLPKAMRWITRELYAAQKARLRGFIVWAYVTHRPIR